MERQQIAKALKKRREELGKTYYRLAVDSGTEQTQIKTIESGRVSFNIDSLVKLCDALGMEIKLVNKK